MNTFAGIGIYCNPESKTHGDLKVMTFSLGIRRNKDVTDWLSCKAFNNQHDFAETYLKHKTKVGVQGKIHEETWEKDGQKHRRHVLVVNEFTFCGSKDETSQAPARSTAPSRPAPAPTSDEMPF